MSIYFNINNACNQADIKDCVCSFDGNNTKKIKSIWGIKGSKVTKLWEHKELDLYEVSPPNEHLKWNYTLDDENDIITLNYYVSAQRGVAVIVYGNYIINEKTYKTKLANNSSNSSIRWMFAGVTYPYSITFSPNIDTSDVTSMAYMFYYCGADIINLNGLNTSNVTDMSHMFDSCKVKNLELGYHFDTSNVTDMSYMFRSFKINFDYNRLVTNNVINMEGMFAGFSGTSLDLSNFNTSNVNNMLIMFEGSLCKTINVSNFNTSNVNNMRGMFRNCKATSLDLSNFDTSNVTNMSHMFDSCKSMENIAFGNDFDAKNVIDMSYMFYDCEALTYLDLRHFYTANVNNMNNMFYACFALTELDISNFDTRNVTDMSYMFGNCIALTNLNLNNFDTNKATNMSYMFCKCAALKTIYVTNAKWVINPSCSTNKMFEGCGTSAVTYV